MQIVVIGGGVTGLTSAYFLRKEGHDVHIIDRGDGTNNCSFGNAGYISPSHFIPLASPGIVAQGLKWMLHSNSPFYIKPRLSTSLMKWGLKFYLRANEKTVSQNAPHLYNLLQLSRQLMLDLDRTLNHDFQLQTKGCLMLYQSAQTAKHEAMLAEEALKLGMEATILSKKEVQDMEPATEVDVFGGVYFPADCHLHPGRMMKSLYAKTMDMGVNVHLNNEVQGFETGHQKVTSVLTNRGKINCDHIVVAPGAWLEILGRQLGLNLLLQAGKGYSTTFDGIKNNLIHPAILVDDRVAMTPLGNELRVGGTMELGGINQNINMNRVKPIIRAANKYYPDLHLAMPSAEKVWTGLRPCSPDGLPYIGNSHLHSNVTVAGGHAMLGVSLAAATGLLVKQLVQHEKTEVPAEAFRLLR